MYLKEELLLRQKSKTPYQICPPDKPQNLQTLLSAVSQAASSSWAVLLGALGSARGMASGSVGLFRRGR